jgi:hypothetical protein
LLVRSLAQYTAKASELQGFTQQQNGTLEEDQPVLFVPTKNMRKGNGSLDRSGKRRL